MASLHSAINLRASATIIVLRVSARTGVWQSGLLRFLARPPSGRMFLIRYQEDGEQTFPAGTILDTTLPLWRMGEVFLHAQSLASLLRKDPDASVVVHFRGLAGRVLRSWSNPLYDLLVQGRPARSDEAVLEARLPADAIEDRMAEYLTPLLASLYDRFRVAGLSVNRVETEVHRLLDSSVGKERAPTPS
ncbi:hypothetical protein [Mesorhizobium abyssinicae]|uniref:hypothetical protein n=1 Tax=Mesorhizobium abyssinicae TaxID=1209958 RepID=UPI0033954F67